MKIQIQVIPNSKQVKVAKISTSQWRVYVNAPAKEGRANKRLIEILADYFKIPKAAVNIIRGHKSKSKLVEIL